MKHLNNAHKAMDLSNFSTSGGVNSKENYSNSHSDYLEVSGQKLIFTIQEKPIKEAGINGLQATDLLIFTKELFKSLNKDFPCRENALTITKIEEALHWQEARTRDRQKRKVECYNKD